MTRCRGAAAVVAFAVLGVVLGECQVRWLRASPKAAPKLHPPSAERFDGAPTPPLSVPAAARDESEAVSGSRETPSGVAPAIPAREPRYDLEAIAQSRAGLAGNLLLPNRDTQMSGARLSAPDTPAVREVRDLARSALQEWFQATLHRELKQGPDPWADVRFQYFGAVSSGDARLAGAIPFGLFGRDAAIPASPAASAEWYLAHAGVAPDLTRRTELLDALTRYESSRRGILGALLSRIEALVGARPATPGVGVVAVVARRLIVIHLGEDPTLDAALHAGAGTEATMVRRAVDLLRAR